MVFIKKLTLVLSTLISVCYAQTNEQAINSFSKSYEYEKKLEYSNAIKELEKIYSDDSYEINIRIAWLQYQAKKYNESITYYKKALAILPYSEEAKLGLSLPYAALEKWDELEKVYLEILKINPLHAIILYKLGLLYYNKGEYIKAESQLKKVVELYPFEYDGLLLYAWINLKLNKIKEAKIFFNKVLIYSPNDSSAQEGLDIING